MFSHSVSVSFFIAVTEYSEINSLIGEGFILVHGFRPWSGHLAVCFPGQAEHHGAECMVEQLCSPRGDQEAKRKKKGPGFQYTLQGHTPSDRLPLTKVSTVSNSATIWGPSLQHMSVSGTFQIQTITCSFLLFPIPRGSKSFWSSDAQTWAWSHLEGLFKYRLLSLPRTSMLPIQKVWAMPYFSLIVFLRSARGCRGCWSGNYSLRTTDLECLTEKQGSFSRHLLSIKESEGI